MEAKTGLPSQLTLYIVRMSTKRSHFCKQIGQEEALMCQNEIRSSIRFVIRYYSYLFSLLSSTHSIFGTGEKCLSRENLLVVPDVGLLFLQQ